MENGRFKLISRNEVSQGKKKEASVKYTMLTTLIIVMEVLR